MRGGISSLFSRTRSGRAREVMRAQGRLSRILIAARLTRSFCDGPGSTCRAQARPRRMAQAQAVRPGNMFAQGALLGERCLYGARQTSYADQETFT
jgi:hypothetical protein